MKKLLILAALFISMVIELKAQSVTVQNTDNENVYWFYIKPVIVIDKDIKKEVLLIKKVYGKIYTGTLNKFLIAYKKELSNAKVAIGPFLDVQVVEQAIANYLLVSKKKVGSQKLNAINDDDVIHYFYLCDPKIDNNTKALSFERIPASVASGSLNDFVEALSNVRLQSLLAVGPFHNYFNAEKSKFVNRKQDANVDTENKYSSINSESLDKMLKKWKSIDIKIIKDSIQTEPNMHKYSIQFDFPARYFDTQTLQAIVIKLEYDDLSQIKVLEKSFNGKDFKDNNEVIPFKNERIWKRNVSAPEFLNKKPQKIIISSMLFNNYKALKCDDVIIEIKNE